MAQQTCLNNVLQPWAFSRSDWIICFLVFTETRDRCRPDVSIRDTALPSQLCVRYTPLWELSSLEEIPQWKAKCRRIHTHSPDSGSAFSTVPHCLCLELGFQRGDERVCWEQGNGRGATRRVKFPGNLPINLYRFKATSESGRKLLWLQIISHPLCWKLFDVDLSTGSWLQANTLTFYGSQNHHGFYWSLFFLKAGAKGSRGSVLLVQPGSSLWTTSVCSQ